MSVGADELYFLGIPVPSETEAAFLAAERTAMAEASVDRLSPSYVFNRALLRNPRIGQFIEFDGQEACSTEFDYLAQDKQDNFRGGLWAGYEILVGSVEYMYFSRWRAAQRETDDLEQYLLSQMMPENDDFEQYLSQITPEKNVSVTFMGPDEIERLKRVRLGKAVIDIGQKTDRASLLAYLDSNRLFQQAPGFYEITDQALARNNARLVANHSSYNEVSASSSAFTQGFYHGVAQAVEVYIQLQEDRIVRKIGVLNQQ